ncbi:MAG: M23 family metallopeptidase, partial [Candidatus Omnitrophota bacterium]|nr:M23 family metallopeptidase [Candidatus Omnitrophota bacterium]
INNDTSGTDDGLGGGRDAYAPDMERPLPVVAGQLLGWMGDSGNAEYTTPHLHFEIRRPDGAAINPYESLTRATHISQPVNHPALPGELLPYGVFQGGSNIATGEFDGDPATRELVTGAGPGGGPHVRIFSEEGELLNQFMAFHPDFRGGVDVAAGDADNDGLDEVIVVPWQNANPIVRVFSTDGLLQREFFAYGEDFQGGVRVGAADLNNDGVTEIVTGTGIGGGPHVRVFSPKGFVVSQFFAYPEQFRGGVDVAAASSTKTSPAMIITGAGPGGGPHVRVFNRFGTVLSQWFPYHESFRGGVRVYAGNAVGKSSSAPEIITSPASRGGPDFRLYSHTG